MEQHQNLLENDLIIDSVISGHLKESVVWAKILSITGFVISGLAVIFAAGTFLLGIMGGRYSREIGTATFLMVIYILIASIAFFMSRVLFQFAKKAQVALQSSSQINLVEAFRNLKIYFRFAAIIAIVSLIFSVLGAIGIAMVATFSRY